MSTGCDAPCSVACAWRCRWSLGHAVAGLPLPHSLTTGLPLLARFAAAHGQAIGIVAPAYIHAAGRHACRRDDLLHRGPPGARRFLLARGCQPQDRSPANAPACLCTQATRHMQLGAPSFRLPGFMAPQPISAPAR